MYTVARFLQLVGLTILPLSIIAQLSGRITVKEMLGFLTIAIGVFSLGYLMQRYSGGGPA